MPPTTYDLKRRRYRPAPPSLFGFRFRCSAIVAGRKAPCGADEIAWLLEYLGAAPPILLGYGLSWVAQKPLLLKEGEV